MYCDKCLVFTSTWNPNCPYNALSCSCTLFCNYKHNKSLPLQSLKKKLFSWCHQSLLFVQVQASIIEITNQSNLYGWKPQVLTEYPFSLWNTSHYRSNTVAHAVVLKYRINDGLEENDNGLVHQCTSNITKLTYPHFLHFTSQSSNVKKKPKTQYLCNSQRWKTQNG